MYYIPHIKVAIPLRLFGNRETDICANDMFCMHFMMPTGMILIFINYACIQKLATIDTILKCRLSH